MTKFFVQFSATTIDWQSKYSASIAASAKSTANSIEFTIATPSTTGKLFECDENLDLIDIFSIQFKRIFPLFLCNNFFYDLNRFFFLFY